MKTDNQRYNESVEPNTAFLNELKSKLPEFFSKDGEFDLDKFQRELKDKNIAELRDGYQLNFIGKDYARRQAGERPSTVIVPDNEQNQGEGKNSQNQFFTGDNLEVLRHLQSNYANKIDVIYIDPPYNTGNGDFVYPDKFEYTDEKLKEMFGMNDDEIQRLKSIQGKSSHSAWLTFMYPRLVIAKKLLSPKGIIFTSIDDNEYTNLKSLYDYIFGEISYIGTFYWNKSKNPPSLSKTIRHKYEYILAYSKEKYLGEFFGGLSSGGDSPLFNGGNKISTLKFPAKSVNFNIEDGVYDKTLSEQIKLEKPVIVKEGKNDNELVLTSKFRWRQDTLINELNNGTNIIIKSKNFAPRYLRTEKRVIVPSDIINSNQGVGTNEDARKLVESLLGKSIFSFPKPTSLVKYLINLGFNSKDNITVLDFFAGSSTTADAVMQLNAEDGGHRKFIMVQLPEKTYTVNSDGSEVPTKGGEVAYNAGFKSIDEISRERIRRAASKIQEEQGLTLPEDFDGSFKHYRVVEPTAQTLDDIEDFDPNSINLFNDMLSKYSSDGLDVPGQSTGEETILTTWLAKDGYSFDVTRKVIDLDGYQATLVDDSRLYLINDGWTSNSTKYLLNLLGTHELSVQTIVLFGYSFNIENLRELEIGVKQLDNSINLLKRY